MTSSSSINADDAHSALALWAGEGVHLIDFLDQPCPIFPGLPGGFIRFQNPGYQFNRASRKCSALSVDKVNSGLIHPQESVISKIIVFHFLGSFLW
jgi:hypothetical protein